MHAIPLVEERRVVGAHREIPAGAQEEKQRMTQDLNHASPPGTSKNGKAFSSFAPP